MTCDFLVSDCVFELVVALPFVHEIQPYWILSSVTTLIDCTVLNFGLDGEFQ